MEESREFEGPQLPVNELRNFAWLTILMIAFISGLALGLSEPRYQASHYSMTHHKMVFGRFGEVHAGMLDLLAVRSAKHS
jgi:hypothetical protein